MRLGRIAAAALLAAALCAGTATAQDLLTRDEARRLALAGSQTLQRALLSVDAAALAEKAGRYEMAPSLSASGGAGLAWPRASLAAAAGASVGLGVSQVIFDGRLPIQVAIDALDTGIARQEARAEYFDVREAADAAFTGVVEAQSSLDAAEADLAAARTREELARARFEAGIVIRADLLKAESETAAAETAAAQARGRLSAAYAVLASLTGRALPFAIDPADPEGTAALAARLAALSDEGTSALIDGVQQAVAAANPGLGKAGLAEQKAAKGRDLAKAGGLPIVGSSLAGKLGVSSTGLSVGGSLSVSVSVPLDSWKVKNSVASADAAVRQAGLDAVESRRTTGLAVRSAVYELVSAARTVRSSAKALQYAQGSYDAALERYRLSTVSSADLGDAASLVSTARKQSITARSQLLLALASLRTLACVETDSLITGLLP